MRITIKKLLYSEKSTALSVVSISQDMNSSSLERSSVGSSASIYPKYVDVLYVYGSRIFGMMILSSTILRAELFSLDDMRKVFLLYFFAVLTIIGACFSHEAERTTTSVICCMFWSFFSTSASVPKYAQRLRKRIRPV